MKPTMSSQGLKVLTREIVPIYEYTNGKKVVLGRDLHKALELKTPYSLWTNQTALRKGEKDVDYWTFKNGQQKEHLISLDMALKIAKVRDPRISRKVSRRLYETSKGNYDPVDFDDLKILDNKPIVKPDEPKKPSLESQLTLFSNDLIPVYLTKKGNKVVLGRELHESLEIGEKYNDWFPRMIKYGDFKEKENYIEFSQDRSDGLKGRPRRNHLLSLETAQKIAQIGRTQKAGLLAKKLGKIQGNTDEQNGTEKENSGNGLTIFNKELIPVYTTDQGEQVVVGRELHECLGIETPYYLWFPRMCEGYDFDEGIDYYTYYLPTYKNVEQSAIGGHNRKDHLLKLDTAKEIAVVQKTPLGKQIRKKLIQLEKNYSLYVQTPSYAIEDPALRARKWADEYEEKRALEQQLKEAQPKLDFANALEESKGCISVGDLAKILTQNGIPMGRNRLFQWFRDNGYLIKQKGTDFNMPTQKSIEKSLFEIVPYLIQKPNGENEERKGVKVTPRGQSYFINKFLKMKKDTQEIE